MEKIVRDGKVAIAISRRPFGEWATSCHINPADARFNQHFLDGNLEEVHNVLKEKGVDHLFIDEDIREVEIVWIPVGTKFLITLEDEFECLYYLEDFDWYEA